jgi:putative hydrolase of the HAD superfamily
LNNGNYAGDIQGILFDLDGTLLHNCPSFTQAFLDYAVQLGAENDPEKRREATRWSHYYWAQSTELMRDRHKFAGDEKSFWLNYTRRHLAAFACPPEAVEALAPGVHRLMTEDHQPEDCVPPEVPETLHALQAAGFRLGVLSNRNNPCHSALAEHNLQSYFSCALVAGELDAWKPDPRVFLQALKRLGTAPEQTVYVGDNYYADILGAQAAGLRAVLLDPDGIFRNPEAPVIRSLDELPIAIQALAQAG